MERSNVKSNSKQTDLSTILPCFWLRSHHSNLKRNSLEFTISKLLCTLIFGHFWAKGCLLASTANRHDVKNVGGQLCIWPLLSIASIHGTWCRWCSIQLAYCPFQRWFASGFEDVEAAELIAVAFYDVVVYQRRFPWVNVVWKTMFW